jgi:hypothetical protein
MEHGRVAAVHIAGEHVTTGAGNPRHRLLLRHAYATGALPMFDICPEEQIQNPAFRPLFVIR